MDKSLFISYVSATNGQETVLITNDASILTRIYSHRECWRLLTGKQNKEARCHSKQQRKWSKYQELDIQLEDLQHGTIHMIECGMKSMKGRLHYLCLNNVPICHTSWKHENTRFMTKCWLSMGHQEEGRGKAWKKTSTQKLFLQMDPLGILARYFREETSCSHHTEWNMEYVFLDTKCEKLSNW